MASARVPADDELVVVSCLRFCPSSEMPALAAFSLNNRFSISRPLEVPCLNVFICFDFVEIDVRREHVEGVAFVDDLFDSDGVGVSQEVADVRSVLFVEMLETDAFRGVSLLVEVNEEDAQLFEASTRSFEDSGIVIKDSESHNGDVARFTLGPRKTE